MAGYWKFVWYKAIFDYVLLNISYTPPTLYVALRRSVWGDEISVPEYSRMPVTWGPVDNKFLSGSNSARVVFNAPTVNWGMIDGKFIYDAVTGGNELEEIGFGPRDYSASYVRWIGPKSHVLYLQSGTIADGDTATIDGVTYTYRSSLTQAYDVSLTAGDGAFDNLRRAINDDGSAGTHYHADTVEHPTCEVPFLDIYYYSYPQAWNDQNSAYYMPVVWKGSGTGDGTAVSSSSYGSRFDAPAMGGGGKPFTIPVGMITMQFYDPTKNVSDYLAKKLYNWLSGQASFTSLSGDMEIALYSTAPSTDDTGGVELTQSGYSRQDITFGSYTLGTWRVNHNVYWTAGENWPNIVAAAIRQKSTGELLFVKSQPNYSVSSGQTFGYDANTDLRIDP